MTDMRDLDHTHPYTDEPFVRPYRRGRVVAADGGRDESRTEPSTDGGGRDQADDERETMEDVPHESPNDGARRTFERGTEGRDESV